LLVLALALLAAPCLSAEDGETVSAPASALTVGDLIQQIDALDRLAADVSGDEELRAALRTLPDAWRVQDGDREHTVSVDALVRAAGTPDRPWEERRESLRLQLATLRTLVTGDDGSRPANR